MEFTCRVLLVYFVDGLSYVLLVNQDAVSGKHGGYDLPGGTSDNLEDPLETAQREVLEEAGLSVDLSEFTNCALFSTPSKKRNGFHCIYYLFASRKSNKLPDVFPNDPDGETLSAKFVLLNEAFDLIEKPSRLRRLKAFLGICDLLPSLYV